MLLLRLDGESLLVLFLALGFAVSQKSLEAGAENIGVLLIDFADMNVKNEPAGDDNTTYLPYSILIFPSPPINTLAQEIM